MTRLLLIRHGQSEWNAIGRWQGQADPPLSELGREQARAAARALGGGIEAIVSSDLKRAAQTAEIISSHTGLSLRLEPRLREIDVGEWSGLTREEIEQRWPGSMDAWRRGAATPPGGELREDFLERILGALRSVIEHDARTQLVVTHGAVIGVLEWHLNAHPGTGTPSLSGRWLRFDGDRLHADGRRVALCDAQAS